jgi:hypothetical protein
MCIMFWMRAYPLRGQVGGGWPLEISSFFGPQMTHHKHNAQGCINHKCIGGFMNKSPRGRFQGPYCGGVEEQVHKLNRPARAAQMHKVT